MNSVDTTPIRRYKTAGISKHPFNSQLVLEERISDSTLRAYNVGFDQNRFRLKPLVDVITSVIPEFAMGYHKGMSIPFANLVPVLREAARRVYTTDKYKSRGEFGELILHLLLRDFCGSVPLISKIYFKDADNATVHGFDGVHIVVNDNENQLWLGESKLYEDGKAGVRDLSKDLKTHLQADYLRREFDLISPKLPDTFAEVKYWRNLLHEHTRLDEILDRVCIPMVCTYTSELFSKHSDNTTEYLTDFERECQLLKETFERKKIETDVDVLLMLLPIESKTDLVTKLDERLRHMQSI